MNIRQLLEAKYGKDIDLSRKSLISLPNDLPSKVEGYFSCHRNQLKSLQYCPTSVGGGFYCYKNQLTTLKYLPKEIGGNIILSGNPDCYEELWMLCKTKLSGDLYINDNEELANLFNKKYKNANHREMLRFQDEILETLDSL